MARAEDPQYLCETLVGWAMREMDRWNRPGFPSELEGSQANLRYNELNRAKQQLRAISNEMRLVVDTGSLAELRDYANIPARDRRLAPKIRRMRFGDAWRDIGDLKLALLDMWRVERNEFAKRVMLDLEGQQK